MSGSWQPILQCDVCGDQLLDIAPWVHTLRDARRESAERGWSSSPGRDHCDRCTETERV